MNSAWDCGRTRLMTAAGIQPFGRENTSNWVPPAQRGLGCLSRGGGYICTPDAYPLLSHPV